MISTSRSHLKNLLLSYGEDALADRVAGFSDNDIDQIGRLAMNYIALHRMIDTQLAAAAVEFTEGSERPLKRSKRLMHFLKNIPEEEKRNSLREITTRSLRPKDR